jgi:hypothetical protein
VRCPVDRSDRISWVTWSLRCRISILTNIREPPIHFFPSKPTGSEGTNLLRIRNSTLGQSAPSLTSLTSAGRDPPPAAASTDPPAAAPSAAPVEPHAPVAPLAVAANSAVSHFNSKSFKLS